MIVLSDVELSVPPVQINTAWKHEHLQLTTFATLNHSSIVAIACSVQTGDKTQQSTIARLDE
jgi:hypothetical protein